MFFPALCLDTICPGSVQQRVIIVQPPATSDEYLLVAGIHNLRPVTIKYSFMKTTERKNPLNPSRCFIIYLCKFQDIFTYHLCPVQKTFVFPLRKLICVASFVLAVAAIIRMLLPGQSLLFLPLVHGPDRLLEFVGSLVEVGLRQRDEIVYLFWRPLRMGIYVSPRA